MTYVWLRCMHVLYVHIGSEVCVWLGVGSDCCSDLHLSAAAAGPALCLQQVFLHLLGDDRLHVVVRCSLRHHRLSCLGVTRR